MVFIGSTTILPILFSANIAACDYKSCERAYLTETKQHIANHVRRVEAYKTERHANSKTDIDALMRFMLYEAEPNKVSYNLI